jgi:hypothetical protein
MISCCKHGVSELIEKWKGFGNELAWPIFRHLYHYQYYNVKMDLTQVMRKRSGYQWLRIISKIFHV